MHHTARTRIIGVEKASFGVGGGKLCDRCLVRAAVQEAGSGLIRNFVRSEDSTFYKLTGRGTLKFRPYMIKSSRFRACIRSYGRGKSCFFIDEHNRPTFRADKSGYKFFYSFKENLCAIEKDGKSGDIQGTTHFKTAMRR